MALKEKVLAYFHAYPQRIVSGETLAVAFKVTRSAVWKAIKELRDQGYQIESVHRQGYQFIASPIGINVSELTHLIQQVYPQLMVDYQEQATSTNDLAKTQAVNLQSHPYYIVASQQTQGRGRYGKSFHSQLEHGLYSSLLIPLKHIDMADIPLITIAAATAMVEAIEEVCGLKLDIKWVNDLFYQGRKVCGILCEGILDMESGQITSVVVGAGLNLAGDFEDADLHIQEVAGTLFGRTMNESIDLNQLLFRYVDRLLSYVEDLEQRRFLTIYTNRLLGLKTRIYYTKAGKRYEAMMEGINKDGHLIVRHDDDRKEELYGQEIHLSSLQFKK